MGYDALIRRESCEYQAMSSAFAPTDKKQEAESRPVSRDALEPLGYCTSLANARPTQVIEDKLATGVVLLSLRTMPKENVDVTLCVSRRVDAGQHIEQLSGERELGASDLGLIVVVLARMDKEAMYTVNRHGVSRVLP